MKRAVWALPVLLWSHAAAALSQPDGTPIPVGGSLQGLFTSRGEAINALNDAATTPETFTPSCGLTFEVLQRNAGYKNSFGWYNVTGQKPPLSDHHEFLSCNDGVGTVKTLDIKKDPAYLGGTIGFYQATGSCATVTNNAAIFYSEKKYNPDGSQANPFIHLLIYNSTVTPKAFYFGWEDLLSGGDNDFDDLTTFVTGISCSGGGGKCQTGKPGVCADGTNQCQSGTLTCVPLVEPSAEKCDGFDNDCNGSVDDGDLCPTGQVCDNGVCVPKCGGGEFNCPANKACKPDKGVCVDPACLTVTCPEGSKCVGGTCLDPCSGAICPKGQACIAGNCVDPCLAITCDSSQVCTAGACIDQCQCAGCATGEQCEASGLCTPAACAGKTCPAGQYCQSDGTCADACGGVVCPAGQSCTLGQCAPSSGSGGSGGASDGGAGSGGLVIGSGGSSGSSASTGAGGGVGANKGGVTESGDEGGCGCRAGAGGPRPWHALLGSFALLLLLRRRRAWPG